jgi:hypothetical protein
MVLASAVTYYVWVHHFGGEGPWGRSNAHITGFVLLVPGFHSLKTISWEAHNVILFGEQLRTLKVYVTPNGFAGDAGGVWEAFSFRDRVVTLRNVLTAQSVVPWPLPVAGQPAQSQSAPPQLAQGGYLQGAPPAQGGWQPPDQWQPQGSPYVAGGQPPAQTPAWDQPPQGGWQPPQGGYAGQPQQQVAPGAFPQPQ